MNAKNAVRAPPRQRRISPSVALTGRAQNANTPLHWAAYSGGAAVCTALLEKEAEVNAKGNVRAAPRQRGRRTSWALRWSGRAKRGTQSGGGAARHPLQPRDTRGASLS